MCWAYFWYELNTVTVMPVTIQSVIIHVSGRDDNLIIGAVMPFMCNGSLESYMRKNRSNVPVKRRITFCKEIAEVTIIFGNTQQTIYGC